MGQAQVVHIQNEIVVHRIFPSPWIVYKSTRSDSHIVLSPFKSSSATLPSAHRASRRRSPTSLSGGGRDDATLAIATRPTRKTLELQLRAEKTSTRKMRYIFTLCTPSQYHEEPCHLQLEWWMPDREKARKRKKRRKKQREETEERRGGEREVTLFYARGIKKRDRQT